MNKSKYEKIEATKNGTFSLFLYGLWFHEYMMKKIFIKKMEISYKNNFNKKDPKVVLNL